MKTIWKYVVPVGLGDNLEISIPKGYKVLTVQMQGGVPTIWVELDPLNPEVSAYFRWIGTGHNLPDYSTSYIGTVQIDWIVLHLFEID